MSAASGNRTQSGPWKEEVTPTLRTNLEPLSGNDPEPTVYETVAIPLCYRGGAVELVYHTSIQLSSLPTAMWRS